MPSRTREAPISANRGSLRRARFVEASVRLPLEGVAPDPAAADECRHADVQLRVEDHAGVWSGAATVVGSADSVIQLGHRRDCAHEVRRIRRAGELSPWERRKAQTRHRPPR
jgi:hypothetical protein